MIFSAEFTVWAYHLFPETLLDLMDAFSFTGNLFTRFWRLLLDLTLFLKWILR